MSNTWTRHQDVTGEIDALADLPRSALVERWQALVNDVVPKGVSRRLLILAIAYEMQAKRYGGLPARVRRQLTSTAGGRDRADRTLAGVRHSLGSGSRLVREWSGRNHVVDVIEGGFLWQGRRYQSLSAVARSITGARWSGPRFFGLDKRESS